MIPIVQTRIALQRIGYVLSILLMSAGWLFLLALSLDWPTVRWSRPALVFEAAALGFALVGQRVRARRLVVYPLILAGSIYLWDTTLPPPNFPAGWPREFIPRLVLLGLVADVVLIVWRRRTRRRAVDAVPQRLALEEAAQKLGLSEAELRIRMQRRRFSIWIDAEGREHVSRDDLTVLRHAQKPAWWQLYLWLLLMLGVSVLLMLAAIPAAWQTAAQIGWCMLTSVGMSVWVWSNRAALRDGERAKWQARKHPASPVSDKQRTIPLTPVQRRYLEIMEQRDEL